MLLSLFDKYNLTPKKIFMIDSVGAGFTALVLLLIQVYLNVYVGMPKKVLSVLIIIAFSYSAFSLFCFCFGNQRWRQFLTIVYSANFLYCLLMVAFIVLHVSDLTTVGIIYFVLEIFVIAALAVAERSYVKNKL